MGAQRVRKQKENATGRGELGLVPKIKRVWVVVSQDEGGYPRRDGEVQARVNMVKGVQHVFGRDQKEKHKGGLHTKKKLRSGG